jgi:UDP-2-acetamido-2,6-beta-L-arabino-hexul-4-ose reductase
MPQKKDTAVKALVTGAGGFIGKNLCVALRRAGIEIAEVDIDSKPNDLLAGLTGAKVVFHLAGVNRPEYSGEFETGNVGSLRELLATMDHLRNADKSAVSAFIVLASSVQAEHDNPYGCSKLAAEKLLQASSFSRGFAAAIYRLPGIFGKWCRPNYNSVVATFCHNIARGLPVTISDPSRIVDLVHVDDVVAQFMTHLESRPDGVNLGAVGPVFTVALGELAERIRAFRATRESLEVSDTSDPFTYRLLGTYVSYLPPSDLTYMLKPRTDARGTLAELLKSPRFGQIFVSRTHPGIIRGNHYHDLKVEKFCVLEGNAVIRFKSILENDVTEHRVSGTDFKVVDIPPGMTHSIENVGSTELIVLFWASEVFDQQRPDTYFSEVAHD